MVFNDLIKKVECIVEHDCAKEKVSGRCAICEVGYHFISKNPIKIGCDDRICKSCYEQLEKNYKCKKHGASLTYDSDRQTQNLIELKMMELFDALSQDFETTISLFEKNENECGDIVENMVLKAKNDIDLRVDKLRESLFRKVDDAAAEIRENFDFKSQIKEARSNLDLLKAHVNEKNSKLSMIMLYEFQEHLRNSIGEIQAYYDADFKLGFEEGDFYISEKEFGKITSHFKPNKSNSKWHVEIAPNFVNHSCDEKIKSVHYLDNDLVAVQKRLKIDICSVYDFHDKPPLRTINFGSNEIFYIPTRRFLLASPYRGHYFKMWSIDSLESRQVRSNGYITAFGMLEDDTLVCGEGIIDNKKPCGFNITFWLFDGLLYIDFYYDTIKNAHEGKVTCIETLTRNRFASASEDKSCKIWSSNRCVLAKLDSDYVARSLKFISPRYLAIKFANNQYMVIDLKTKDLIAFKGRENRICAAAKNKSIAANPNGYFLVMFDDCVRVFDCNSFAEVSSIDASSIIANPLGIDFISYNNCIFFSENDIKIFKFENGILFPK